MPHFSTKVDGLATGAVANTYLTVLGLKMANTAGHRAKLRRLVISGGGGAPQDEQASIRIRRTGNTADGTSTAVNVNTIAPKDEGCVASNIAAMGKNYTVEPTTYATEILAGGSLNARGQLVLSWPGDDAPQFGINQTLGIEAAPGQAVALNLEALAEWEEF